MSMIKTYINIQESDLVEGVVLNEMDGVRAIEAFKELDGGIGAKGLKEEDAINKPQSESGLIKFRASLVESPLTD